MGLPRHGPPFQENKILWRRQLFTISGFQMFTSVLSLVRGETITTFRGLRIEETEAMNCTNRLRRWHELQPKHLNDIRRVGRGLIGTCMRFDPRTTAEWLRQQWPLKLNLGSGAVSRPQRYSLVFFFFACFFVGTLTPRACPIMNEGLTPTKMVRIGPLIAETVPKGTRTPWSSLQSPCRL